MIDWGTGPYYVILLEEEYLHTIGWNRNQWCPGGLTRSQKRHVQRLRQLEIIEEEQEQTLSKKGVKTQVWHVKAKADGESASNSSAPIQAVSSSESS